MKVFYSEFELKEVMLKNENLSQDESELQIIITIIS